MLCHRAGKRSISSAKGQAEQYSYIVSQINQQQRHPGRGARGTQDVPSQSLHRDPTGSAWSQESHEGANQGKALCSSKRATESHRSVRLLESHREPEIR